jgi:hypothetical protein
MLARVDVKLYGGEIDYKIYEVKNLDEAKQRFNGRCNVIYVGEIISDNQKETFKMYGNTVIPKSLYDKVDNLKLIQEFKRILNCNCAIKQTQSGTIIVEKVKN